MAAVVTTLVIGQLVLAVWFLIYEKETYRKAREASSTMEAKFLAEYLEFRHPHYPMPIVTSPIQEIRDNVALPAVEFDGRAHGAHS